VERDAGLRIDHLLLNPKAARRAETLQLKIEAQGYRKNLMPQEFGASDGYWRMRRFFIGPCW
jgi:exonuclease III